MIASSSIDTHAPYPSLCCCKPTLQYIPPAQSPGVAAQIAADPCTSHIHPCCCLVLQAQLATQQAHHQAMTAEAQLALSRQKLRQHVAAGAKPLAMSGWEDLVDEAAADLQRVEAHVAAAAARLIELQVLGWLIGDRHHCAIKDYICWV